MCQVRKAVSALVRSWWLDGLAADLLFQQAADEIADHQRRNAQARASHTKTTIDRLQQLGIDLNQTQTVPSNTS